MSNVLHIITGLSTGGAERSLYNLLAGGVTKTGKTAVLSLSDEGSFGPKIRELGVPLYTLNMRRGLPTPGNLSRLRSLVKSFKPDLVQGWMYHGNLAAILAATLGPGDPAVIWNIRQSLYDLSSEKWLTRQVIRANRLFSRRVDSILYNSHLARSQHEGFGFARQYGRIIPNGFDTSLLQPDLSLKQRLREQLGIPEEAVVIGHVARFHPMKDHASFVRAAIEVLQSCPHAYFVLVGRDVDSANPVFSGAIPEKLASRFQLLGERTDATELMQALDILCSSSAWGEGFPNVVAEAMCLEVPCVVTDVGDSRIVIGDTGIMVPPNNTQLLAQALVEMIELPQQQRRIKGQAARQRIVTEYSLTKVVDMYVDLYRKNLLSHTRPKV